MAIAITVGLYRRGPPIDNAPHVQPTEPVHATPVQLIPQPEPSAKSVHEQLAPTAVPATPVISPPLTQPGNLECFELRDGRFFVGSYRADVGSLMVRAAVRGGVTTLVPDMVITVVAAEITARRPYRGEYGDLSTTPVPRAPDPVRSAENARAREQAQAQAAQRRTLEAERERVRARTQRRNEVDQRVIALTAAIARDQEREQKLTAHVPQLEEFRKRQDDLLVGLQLQYNTAQDRWNIEIQERNPIGRQAGRPTLATEQLVSSLQQQIQAARAARARATRELAAESAEQRLIRERLPNEQGELAGAKAEATQMVEEDRAAVATPKNDAGDLQPPAAPAPANDH
ncbi:MAG: hypothetical protein AAB263_09280 [Planctomycetota bacterium]